MHGPPLQLVMHGQHQGFCEVECGYHVIYHVIEYACAFLLSQNLSREKEFVTFYTAADGGRE